MFYEQTESLIGSTPLLRLAAFEKRQRDGVESSSVLARPFLIM